MGQTRAKIGRRLRYAVFERDAFKCRYCGRAAPDVVLYVDHHMPFSKGGTEEFSNLVTVCEACNLGKTNLSPAVAVSGVELSLHESAAFLLGYFVGMDRYCDDTEEWGRNRDRAKEAILFLSGDLGIEEREKIDSIKAQADFLLTLYKASHVEAPRG